MKSLLLLIILIFPTILVSQDFDKYYKEKQKQFDEYLNKTEEEYKKFVEERDKEFSKHLKENWESFSVKQSKSYLGKPQPDRFPVYVDSVKQKFNILEFNSITDTVFNKPQIRKIKTYESYSFYKKKLASIQFYGETIKIEYEDLSDFTYNTDFSNARIAQYWDDLNKLSFDNCMSQLVHEKERLNLNDWGYYLLVRDFTMKISDKPEFYKLLLWYILLKSEYNVKIGYASNELLLLIPFNTDIYGIPYYEINQEVFYVFENDNPQTIRTYLKYYPGANHSINPELDNIPSIHTLAEKKNVECEFKGQKFPVYIDVNTGLKDFYNSYPLMDLYNYFNSAMSENTKKTLFDSFRKIIDGKNEQEAVSFLLYFSQNAFRYKSDIENFGKEKIYFPDEIFFYNYSDCEDRAIFFAYIVKELLNLKVIGLDYDDHVAVAVNFKDSVPGNFISWKGEKYVVCDPTYINAPIGRIPPDKINRKATLINIEIN